MLQVIRPDVAANDAAVIRSVCLVCFSGEQKEEMKRHYDHKSKGALYSAGLVQ